MRVFFFLCLSAALAGAQSDTRSDPLADPPADTPSNASPATDASKNSATDAAPKRAGGERARTPGRLAANIPEIANTASRVYPLMNAEILDARGVRTSVVAFHRISGENRFRGYLGAAEVDIPYERVSEIR